jgi:hypothetical protein
MAKIAGPQRTNAMDKNFSARFIGKYQAPRRFFQMPRRAKTMPRPPDKGKRDVSGTRRPQ